MKQQQKLSRKFILLPFYNNSKKNSSPTIHGNIKESEKQLQENCIAEGQVQVTIK